MSVSETSDPTEVKLASYFEEIYEALLEEGVPEDRLPTPWHMLSRMVKCLDPDLLREWIDAYVAVEAELYDETEEEDEAEPGHQPRPKPKHRPSYLRALDTPLHDQDDDEQEEKTRDDGS